MSNLISGFCFIRVATLRICYGLAFIGLTVAAHTVRADEGSLTPNLDILTIQRVRSGADWLLSYRLSTNVALTRSSDTVRVRPRFSSVPKLHFVAELKKESVGATDLRWQIVPNSDRVSLSPLLRFESKGERLEIKPRRTSVSVVWRKAFP